MGSKSSTNDEGIPHGAQLYQSLGKTAWDPDINLQQHNPGREINIDCIYAKHGLTITYEISEAI